MINAPDQSPDHLPEQTPASDGGSKALAADRRQGKSPEPSGKAKDLIADALAKDRPSFFDCNICLAVAADPVLTPCGHLFCWSCLYRWIHLGSDATLCPVCDLDVAESDLIPIYVRGAPAASSPAAAEGRILAADVGIVLPPRPRARRIESSRQRARAAMSGLEEAIQRLRYRASLMRRWMNVVLSEDSGEGVDLENFTRRFMRVRERVSELHDLIRSSSRALLEDYPGNSPVEQQQQRAARLMEQRAQAEDVVGLSLGVAGEHTRPRGDGVLEERGSGLGAGGGLGSGSRVLNVVSELESIDAISPFEVGRRRRRRRNSENSTALELENGILPVSRRRRAD